MTQEALKLALDAILNFPDDISDEMFEAITAIKEALAQPEQEPDKYVMDIECTKCGAKQSGILTVNTTPPQRTWIGLTDDEISELIRATHNTGSFARAIEAKLKEKNT